MWNFFFGKNETLAQSLVDGAIRAIFSGIIVAVVSLYVLGAVEDSMDRAKKRAALQDFQNAMLSETLSEVSTSFSELHCTRNKVKLLQTKCKNKLNEFVALLRERGRLLKALISQGDFSSIDSMIDIATQMQSIQNPDERRIHDDTFTEKFAKTFTIMMKNIATNF